MFGSKFSSKFGSKFGSKSNFQTNFQQGVRSGSNQAKNLPLCEQRSWQKLIFCSSSSWVSRGVVLSGLVTLALILCSHYYAQPQLVVNALVDRDIRAPFTAEVKDIVATEKARSHIRKTVIPEYKNLDDASHESEQRLQNLLKAGDRLRNMRGSLSFIAFNQMTWQEQLSLLQLTDQEWKNYRDDQLVLRFAPPVRTRYQLNPSLLGAVRRQIGAARRRYQMATTALATPSGLWQLTDAEWQELKELADRGMGDLLSGGIHEGISPELLERRIRALRSVPASKVSADLFVQLLRSSVRPNLRVDYVQTTEKALTAVQNVQAVTMRVQAGELLLRAGAQVTERDFAILDQLGLAGRQPNWVGIALVTLATTLAVLLLLGLCRMGLFRFHNADGLAIFLSCTAIALGGVIMIPQGIAFLPLASLGLTLGCFYCRRSATLITLLMAGLIGVATMPSAVSFLPIVAGGVAAGIFTNRPRARSHVAAVGVGVGAVQALSFVAISLLLGAVPPILVLATALQYGLGGLISAILALGAIPYLEQVSYALTPFRLAELADFDRPLLRRLVTEAPGTFQHTLFVANLAEAAARELKADTALVRTGTLYHDIGKTLKPEYFIENQMGQTNPHDDLNDPWCSAQIIKEHVTGGLKLAQQYRLPKQLQAFIPEHQGTIIISYFYGQALQQFPELGCEDFRYAGPIPQSRETGIVMLADACEAALRSLGQDTNLDEAKEMVWRIFQARWQDGQLAEAGLSLAELDRMADVFLKVWLQRNHGRIKYPAFAKKVDPTGSQLDDGPTAPYFGKI